MQVFTLIFDLEEAEAEDPKHIEASKYHAEAEDWLEKTFSKIPKSVSNSTEETLEYEVLELPKHEFDELVLKGIQAQNKLQNSILHKAWSFSVSNLVKKFGMAGMRI